MTASYRPAVPIPRPLPQGFSGLPHDGSFGVAGDRQIPLTAATDRQPLDAPLGRRHAGLVEVGRAIEPDGVLVRQALDAVSDGVVIVSEGLVVEYRNAAAVRLSDGGGPALEREVHTAAADALRHGAANVREVESEGRRYELRAAPFATADVRPRAVVVVTCTSRAVPSAEAIAQRHGLSPREGAVARLLAKGFSNDAIVRKLGISVSTARHYTERILVKLGTRSRGEAAAIILGTMMQTDEYSARPMRTIER